MIQITEDFISWVNSLYINNHRPKKWDYYKYQNVGVPRVTTILDECMNNRHMLQWAANLGSLEEYLKIKYTALDTGTLAHEMIEDYLIDGYINSNYKIRKYANVEGANIAYQNYRNFEMDLYNKGYSIDSLMLELECVGPLYGGTIDFIANINNIKTLETKMYLLDFKTSKKIIKEYLLQIMLYTLNINYLKSIGDPFYSNFDIKGIGIIRVDKSNSGTKGYQYLLIDFDQDKELVDQLAINAIELIKYYYSAENYKLMFEKSYKKMMNKEVIF